MVDNLSGTAERHCLGHDHLYSPCVVFNGIGTVIERYEYDVYGKAKILTANFADKNNISVVWVFSVAKLSSLDGS